MVKHASTARLQAAGLAIVGLGASIAPLDFSVNIAFPAITAAFGLETRAIRWVAVCYVLTYGSLMLAFGALGDRIGHLRVFRAGVLLGAAAFMLCALAPSYTWLLSARVLQGVAVALTLACAPALAMALFDENRRTWALSMYGGMSALAGVIAPIAGGVTMAQLDWPGVYWFRVPIVLAAFFCVPLLARGLTSRALPARSARSARSAAPAAPINQAAPAAARAAAAPTVQVRPAFDFPGMALLAASVALLLLAPALMETNALLWPALPVALGGVLLMTVFIARQRAAATPFLPHAVMRDPDFIVPNIAAVVVQGTSFAIPLILPYYLSRIGGWTPLATGMLLSCWAAGALAGSGIAHRLLRAFGVRRTAFAAGLLVLAGLVAIALWPALPALVAEVGTASSAALPAVSSLPLLSSLPPVSTAPSPLLPAWMHLLMMVACLLLQGVGIGLYQVAYSDIVVASLPVSQRGVAGSLTMVTRTVGIVLGVSLLTWILQSVEAAALARGLEARAAFMEGFHAVYWSAAAMAGVTFAASALRWRTWFVRDNR